ncbi:MAG: hypothetical protein ACYDCK_01810 [Thermoplasmatota archaeon]
MRLVQLLWFALVTLTLVASPSLASGWSGGPVSEPNTRFDRSPDGQSSMWQFANDGKTRAITERVYFDAVAMHSFEGLVNFDPNPDGGRTPSPVETTFMAFLGYWRDCNADGYIGDHSVGLDVYPTLTLDGPGLARCPRGSPYDDGTFVDGFRWIGPDAAPDASDPGSSDCVGNPLAPTGPGLLTGCHANRFDVSDCSGSISGYGQPPSCADVIGAGGAIEAVGPHSKVWSDWGRPGRAATPSVSLIPLPRGTLDDSDGTLQYVDDLTYGTPGPAAAGCPDLRCGVDSLAGDGTWDSKPCVGNDGRCLLRQTFYPPYQVKRLYNDSESDSERGSPFVEVWDYNPSDQRPDCAEVTDPEHLVGTPGLDPRVDPTFGSDPLDRGSIDPTVAQATRPDFLLVGDTNPGSCTKDGIHPIGTVWPSNNLEADGASSTAVLKTHVDQIFTFKPDARTDAVSPTGLPSNAPEGGYSYGRSNVLSGSPGWYSPTVWVMARREPAVEYQYVTTYAALTSAAIFNNTYSAISASTALPAGTLAAHTYGADRCPSGFGAYVGIGGWSCDMSAWQADVSASGAPVLGHHYDLRDVDCYDNRLFAPQPVATPVGAPVVQSPELTAASIADPADSCDANA